MLPAIVYAPLPAQLERLLELLTQASDNTHVHAQVMLATCNEAEVQSVLNKNQGLVLLLTWLPHLCADMTPKCVELGQQVMDINHDSYTLYVANESQDLVHASVICRRAYAVLLAEDLQATGVPVMTQLLNDFRSTTDPSISLTEDFIMLRIHGSYIRVPKIEILYIESLDKKLVFYLQNQALSLYSSITSYEELLSDQFIRCHRSYLVNQAHIQSISLPDLTLQLSNGATLPISRSQRSRMKELLSSLLASTSHS